MFLQRRLILSMSAVLFAALPCVASDSTGIKDLAERPKRMATGIVSIGLPSVPVDLDPLHIWASTHYLLLQMVFQNLIRSTEDGRMVSDLALSWEMNDIQKTVTFHLDPKANSGGVVVTAHDVQRSLSRHFWPGSKSIVSTYLESAISGSTKLRDGETLPAIEAIDPHTVRFHVKAKASRLLDVLSMPGFVILPSNCIDFTKPVGSGLMTAQLDEASHSWMFTKKVAPKAGETRAVQISIYKDTEDGLAKLNTGRLDILMGVPLDEAPHLQLGADFKLLAFSSLSYSHLFLNTHDQRLRDAKVREYLVRALSELKREDSSPHALLTPLDSYLPRGVMPPSYYEREPIRQLQSAEQDYLRSHLKGRPLRVTLVKDWLPTNFATRFKAVCAKMGFDCQIIEIKKIEIMGALKQGDYDIITGAYLGTYPDPDGFTDPLNENSHYRLGYFPTRELFQQLEAAKALPGKQATAGYEKAFLQFEHLNYFVPLFQMHLPIIVHNKLSFPENKYRFENEMWRFIWKAAEN